MSEILEDEETLWAQEGLVPISALQHYVYCPRQCALIHVEQIWEENIYTLRGRRAHERVEIPEGIVREGVRVEYALPLWSQRLGLVGRADVVEFPDGVPYPVEHKVGPRRARHADEVQLCAQALCLEEMLGVRVPKGALFYPDFDKWFLKNSVRKGTSGISRDRMAPRSLQGSDRAIRPVSPPAWAGPS
ncbi:CRISPR-associated protein Cas4 [Candidatus Bipolaricaulota sp. J31]